LADLLLAPSLTASPAATLALIDQQPQPLTSGA
jgi:hypothetical protein